MPRRRDVEPPVGPFESDCGRVKAFPPSHPEKRPYWRIEVVEDGRRRQFSGGRTGREAWEKLSHVVARLDAGNGDRGLVKVGVLLDRWMDAPASQRVNRRQWSEGYREGNTYYVEKYLRPFGEVRAMDLGKSHYRRIVNAAPTMKEAEQVRRRLSSFVTWGRRLDHFTAVQKADLELARWDGREVSARPDRRSSVRTAGESDTFLRPEDRMGFETLTKLGDALQLVYPYGKLYAEVLAVAGLRQSEAFALTVDDLDLARRLLNVNWQVASKGRPRLVRPKGNKVRSTVLPKVVHVPTGFDVLGALEERVSEASLTSRRLVFPAPMGGWWSATNFSKRLWEPASTRAGMPVITWTDAEGTEKSLWRYTSHSLRDRFAITALDEWGWTPAELQRAGGWSTAAVIFSRYYGSSDEALEAMREKTG